jgi:hypothetical protein
MMTTGIGAVLRAGLVAGLLALAAQAATAAVVSRSLTIDLGDGVVGNPSVIDPPNLDFFVNNQPTGFTPFSLTVGDTLDLQVSFADGAALRVLDAIDGEERVTFGFSFFTGLTNTLTNLSLTGVSGAPVDTSSGPVVFNCTNCLNAGALDINLTDSVIEFTGLHITFELTGGANRDFTGAEEADFYVIGGGTEIVAAAVPAPMSLALLASGLLGLAASRRRLGVGLAAALCAGALLAAPATAAPATYIVTGTAIGTLDGNAFSGVLTVTISGDTADIVVSGGGTRHRNTVLSTVIDVPGFGAVSVTGPDYVFVNQNFDKFGYGVEGISPLCCDIIQFEDPAFDTYDLTTSLGPLAFPTNLSTQTWGNVPTSGGLLTVTSYIDNTASAVADAPVEVPETGALAVLACGLLGLACSRPRRRKLT